ncbi:MAG: hypothetical protein Hens3KO_19440 [Henriciella sp.]
MTTTTVSPPQADPQTVALNVVRPARVVPIWEQAAVTLWFLVTFVEIPFASPLRYLLLGAFLVYFAAYHKHIVMTLLRCWPLFLLPIYGAFSFIWAAYSGQAMRIGILYLLTPFIIVIIAARMELKTILRCFFFAGVLATLFLLPEYQSFHWGTYYYGSKNYLALHMVFAQFFALITVLNPQERQLLRLFAAPFVPICFWIVIMANSATSAIFAVVGTIGLLAVRFFWLSITRMRHLRSVTLLSGMAMALLGAAIVLSMPSNSIVNDFLDMMGKDSTLTGRTAIWTNGKLAAEENPIFGVGLESFWQRDIGSAQTILENDHKPFGIDFTFHNAYLEVRVHLGYVGYALFWLIVGWCLYRTVIDWLRDPSMERSAMLVITAIIFTSTFTESWLWNPFNALTNLFYLAAISSLGTAHRKVLGRIPAVIKPSLGAGVMASSRG